MPKLSYRAGDWLGIVRANTVIVLEPRTEAQVLADLWEFLAQKPKIDEVLTKVTAGFGTELTGMPAFGIFTFDERPRAILRGEMELIATAGSHRMEVSGREVTTWSERSLPEAELFELRLAGEESAAVLPLSEGVVRLSMLLVGVAELAPARLLAAEGSVAEDPAAGGPVDEGLSEIDLSRTLISSDLTEAEERPVVAALSTVAPQLEPALELQPEPQQEPAPDVAFADPIDTTSSYDHLWDRTIARSVEDAAIRVSGEPDVAEPLQSETPAATPAPKQSELFGALEASEPPEEAPGVLGARPPEPVFPGLAEPVASVDGSVNSTGLIESVPWGRPTAGVPHDLVVASPTTSGGNAPVPRDQHQSDQNHGDQDHDGQTVLRSVVPASAPALTPEPAAEAAPATGPLVLARLCAAGHANPPSHARCSECGQAVAGEARQVRRPVLGRMRMSSGEVIDLDQSLIVGRQPSVSRVHGDGMPKLVQVASRAGDISRSHVEIRLEGWDATLVDLKATNGTVLVREGQPPRRLGQGEQAMLLNGDIAELGEDVSLRFEGLR